MLSSERTCSHLGKVDENVDYSWSVLVHEYGRTCSLILQFAIRAEATVSLKTSPRGSYKIGSPLKSVVQWVPELLYDNGHLGHVDFC